MTTSTTMTEPITSMEGLGDPKDYRDAQWKVVEETGKEGTMELHLRTKQQGRWRKKHRILAVVCKAKPAPGVQLRTTNGSFLLAIDKAVVEGMNAELRTALESCKDQKKRRTAFCSEYFFFRM